jgi:hypothetical protein
MYIIDCMMKPGNPDVVVDGGWCTAGSTQAEISWPGLNQGGDEYLSMTLPDIFFPYQLQPDCATLEPNDGGLRGGLGQKMAGNRDLHP